MAAAPGLAPDPQADLLSWVAGNETWLPIGGVKRPVAVVLGPQGERLDLHLSGPGFDGAGWFAVLAARGVQGLTSDDDPVYGPALEAAGLDRQPCAVPRQRTVGRHIRGLDEGDLTHLDRVLLALWEAVMQGRVRLHPETRRYRNCCGTSWRAGRVPSGRASSPGPV